MEWFIEHFQDIFQVIGYAYLLGRAIVFLTPSTSDDKDYENKVGRPVKWLAALLGLNLDQGRKL